jgi:two-component system LytT family response regulator
MSIRALIVDDEPWARTRISTLLSAESDVSVVGACETGESAVGAIAELKPDVVFLDVQMADLDGFGVVDAIGIEAMPLVVFVTAHEQHALRAFEAQALDYLLKPFDEDRFKRTMMRVRRELSSPTDHVQRVQRAIDAARGERRHLRRMAVTHRNRLLFIKVEDIDWIESSGNYVNVHVSADTYLLRETLSALEEKLDPDQFVRLHRCTMVNVDRIRELSAWTRGEQIAMLNDGTQLAIGRAYRSRLMAMMSNTVG